MLLLHRKRRGEETSHLETDCPLAWQYLNSNKELFYKRKSSIYNGAPDFSMFGVGDYSYLQYKVGVSGFYKEPLFSVLFSSDGKPVMTDDTSYFICFPTYELAYTAMLYLNSSKVQLFLKSITFLDSKRPYTKKVLERIDFSKIYVSVSYDGISKDIVFEEKDAITNAIYDSCEPVVLSNIYLQTINDKTIIVVEIASGMQRLYFIKSLGSIILLPEERKYLD